MEFHIIRLNKLLFLFIFFIPYFLEASWKKQKESLEYVFFKDEFRIFYSLTGKHALPVERQKDKNLNTIPDYIDDIVLQLRTSSLLLSHLGFIHPLKNERYKSQGVKYIDVHLLNSKTGGGAGDAVIQYKYKSIPNKSEKALAINLSVNLKEHSLTPFHEFFHLVQNGYTMFKNSWFEEGTARWSEWILRYSYAKQTTLPQTEAALNKVLNQSYGTYSFWSRLGVLCDERNGEFIFNEKLTYLDNKNIIEDKKIYGIDFMKEYLATLSFYDKKRTYNESFSRYDWIEKEQRSLKNNDYMLCALYDTILSKCDISNTELSGFMKILSEITQNKCRI